MACNCNSIVAEKVLGDFRLKTPNATEHSVILLNYALVFDNGFTEKAFMMASQSAKFPTKKGTYLCKTKRVNLIYSHCPFCGILYSDTGNNGSQIKTG